MALSGSVNTNSYEGRYYQVSWTASQSTANNQSAVSWTLKALGGKSSWYAERALNVSVAGKNVYRKTDRVRRYAGTIASGTVTVNHSSNGEASFSISINAAVYVSSINCKGSQSFTLNTIPRKSSLSVGNGTLGTAQTLTVTRQSSSFTHTIIATCGGQPQTIITKSTSTSISFTPPLDWASENTSGTSVSVAYTITTYKGNTSVGSNSYTKTCSIPSSVKPSCSVAVTDGMGYADKYGAYVKGRSKFKVVVTAQTSYGSSIASYSTTANGSTYTASSFTTDELKSSGSLLVQATVKDKRGRSESASVTVTVLDYTAPVISKLSVKRCNSDGTENDKGEYVQVIFNSTITSLNNKNNATYKLQYKKSTDAEYTSVTLTDYVNNYQVTGGLYIFAADSGSSFDVQLTVTDDFSETTHKTSASTGFTLMHWLASGLGMAIGKVSEVAGYLDIGLKTLFRDDAFFNNNGKIYGISPSGNTVEAFTPVNESGNTVIGWGNYNGAHENTNIYGHDINFGVSNIAEPGAYRPYRRKGDSIIFTIRTAGYVTRSGTEVAFYIPFSEPIIGNPSVSVTSGNGFVLRQGAKYTHGSASNIYVTPNTYTASVNMFLGVLIIATFSDTTNVTNNDAIGIYWNGTITFS